MRSRRSSLPAAPAALPALQLWMTLASPTWVALSLSLSLTLVSSRLFRNGYTLSLLLVGLLGLYLNFELRAVELEQRGQYALSAPLGAAHEREWIGLLSGFPRDSGADSLTIVLQTEVGSLRCDVIAPTAGERTRLGSLRPGTKLSVWAKSFMAPDSPIPNCSVKSSRLVRTIHDGSRPPWLTRIRSAARDRISGQWDPESSTAKFYSAILLGLREANSDWQERFAAVGLAHIIAISGLHVGIVSLLLLGLLFRLFRRVWLPALLLISSLAVFVPFAGGGLPVARAAGCASLLIFGRWIGREGNALNRLTLAALVILISRPQSATEVGFLLSFVAVGSILSSRGSSTPTRITIQATLGTAPLCAYFFGSLTPLAPLSNLLALPLLPLMLLSGYATVALPTGSAIQTATAELAARLFEWLHLWASWIDQLPGTPLYVAEPNLFQLVVFYLAFFGGRLLDARRRALTAIAAITLWSIVCGPPPQQAASPRAELIDVGQGQSLLWANDGERSLVDAGGRGWGSWDPGERVVLPTLYRYGWDRLDRLILSHGDADHAAGATVLLERIEIAELWLGPHWWHDDRLAQLAEIAVKRGAAIRLVSAGTRVDDIQILAPVRTGRRATSSNANSLVVLLGDRPHRIFVPGDLDGAALRNWIDHSEIPASEAFVLPHHGSRHGISGPLLDQLQARMAIASCGYRNRFNHPAAGWIKLLDQWSIPLWRTDYDGHVRLIAKQEGWAVQGSRERGHLERQPMKTGDEDDQCDERQNSP